MSAVPEQDDLIFDAVSKGFGGGPPVLQGLSASVPLQGLTFVVGKSGSGKSVLCRLAVGLLRPDSGRVRLLDQSIEQANERQLQKVRQQVPYLVQGPALLDWLTLAENVALAGEHRPGPLGPQVALALERVGLGKLADRLPPSVSPGVKKRTAIARALVLEPRFLLLDEPTTGLDRAATAQVNEVIVSLRREGLGAMVVSHDYRSLEAMADRVLLVSAGKAGFSGSRDAFFASDDAAVRALLEA